MPNIIEISDFNASELDVFARLSESQLVHIYEPDLGLFIAESPKVINRALNAGYEPVSILTEKNHIETHSLEIIQKCKDVPIFTADSEVLTKLTGFKLTRGLLCAMKRRSMPNVTEICQNAKRVAVLENVVNPTNVGAIFRSAAALGFDAVLLTSGCSDPLYRRSSRVSMGTVFQIPWTYMKNEYSELEHLKSIGFKTVSMALSDDSISLDSPKLQGIEKLAVILGTEGDGLAETTITNSDFTVRIPMAHGIDSLNVAAASAVAFWQLGLR